MSFITPDQALQRAKELMLGGREPESKEDWQRIINCWASNLYPDNAEAAIKLLVAIYEIPVPEHQVLAIINFHKSRN